MRRVVIAGAGSGVGKTTLATGIMSLLSRRYRVQGFKVGPDFIDPMFHRAATGRPSRNLDSVFMDRGTLRNLFGWATRDADVAVIEGVRGLYDGLTATGDQGSTAEIAKMLRAPVILVVNARSLAKSAAAHVLGFKALDPEIHIAGVILNQVSGPRHRQKAVEAVESLTGTEVVGVVERRQERLTERHLGLVTMPERDAEETLRIIEDFASELDLERIIGIAESAPDESFPDSCPFPKAPMRGVKVAVPRDRAFSFYYEENLESMRFAGAEVIEYRPTEGERLPEADVHYLGGGYPEIYHREISTNHDFLEGLRTASDDGRLLYGECGGMMTFCQAISYGDEESPMAGIFPYKAELTLQRQGLAYVKAQGTPDNPLFPNMEITAHEFHYSRMVPTPIGHYVYNVMRGTGIDGAHDGLMVRKTVGTYMHQHALATKCWGMSIVDVARSLKK